jgi:ABC-type arginine/histidine transport system permease subunit
MTLVLIFVVLTHGAVIEFDKVIVEPMIELTLRLVVLIFRATTLFVLIFVVLIHGLVSEVAREIVEPMMEDNVRLTVLIF